jgi:hypothetical protein
MSRGSSGTYLSAVFVDYDNIYLSLKRKSEEAAKRFAKESYRWVKALESGELITQKYSSDTAVQRRIVMCRCYGNPVPRRNQADNSTDMSSFPFVRHHFLRGGFEIIDCPPLTAQLKNSADIRMVMDIRDFLTHDTYFDEFVILSSDADFTPLLHRLRAHARRTVIYANDHTAQPYAALSDGEVRESRLLELLLEDAALDISEPVQIAEAVDFAGVRDEIIEEVVRAVLEASAPQPLEALAERAIRAIGQAKTVGTDWGGAGGFRELLLQELPETVKLTEKAPYFAYDVNRAVAHSRPQRIAAPEPEATRATPTEAHGAMRSAPSQTALAANQPAVHSPSQAATAAPAQAAAPQPESEGSQLSPERASSLQRSIALIHKASEAPPLSPPEYRAIFTLLANEIATNQLQGVQTVQKVRAMALEVGIDIKPDDLRFVIGVIGKADPWFEQEVSAPIFASRFRNFVIARCQTAGLNLSSDEIDLIDAWFGGGEATSAESSAPARQPAPVQPSSPDAAPNVAAGGQTLGDMHVPLGQRTARWWQETTGGNAGGFEMAGAQEGGEEEFPRIVRNRFKGS